MMSLAGADPIDPAAMPRPRRRVRLRRVLGLMLRLGRMVRLRRPAWSARPDEYADSYSGFLMNMRFHPGCHDDHDGLPVAGGATGPG
jgi:hypothetical protein